MLPNDLKLRINVIDQLDTDFFMAKNQFFLSKHHQKLHIQKNMHFIYKQDFYKDKQKEINELLLNTFSPSWTILIILRLLKNVKKLDAAAYEKNKPRCKDTIN